MTDGVYIKTLPSKQLSQKKVNGKRLLVGVGSSTKQDFTPPQSSQLTGVSQHNANEGPLFTPPNIATDSALTAWLKLEFPNLSAAQINQILASNPTKTGVNDTHFETNGLTGLTAMDVSQAGTGQQQRANVSNPHCWVQIGP